MFSFFGSANKVNTDEGIDEELIASLINTSGYALWASQQSTYTVTFNTKYFERVTGSKNLEALPAHIQTQCKIYLKELAAALGFTILFKDFPGDLWATNSIMIYQQPLEQRTNKVLAFCRATMTVDGTPETPGLLKEIQLNPKTFDMCDFKRTLWHEFFHAAGLKHPTEQPFKYSSPLSCDQTIMVTPCASSVPDREACEKALPNPLLSKEDVIAYEEQLERHKNHSHVSVYQQRVEARKQREQEEFQRITFTPLKSFASSFIASFTQGYIKPYLIENYHLNNAQADLAGTLICFLFDSCLYSMPAVASSMILRLTMAKVFSFFNISPSNFLQMGIINTIDMTIKGYIDTNSIAGTILSTTAGALGHKAAWELVKALPKIHAEERSRSVSLNMQ